MNPINPQATDTSFRRIGETLPVGKIILPSSLLSPSGDLLPRSSKLVAPDNSSNAKELDVTNNDGEIKRKKTFSYSLLRTFATFLFFLLFMGVVNKFTDAILTYRSSTQTTKVAANLVKFNKVRAEIVETSAHDKDQITSNKIPTK